MNKRKLAIMILVTLAIITFSHLEVLYRPRGADAAILTDLANRDSGKLGDFPSAAVGIRVFQDRVKRNPRDAVSLTILGQLYLRQARETGDVANYPRAEAALYQALDLIPGYVAANTALASAFYAQHKFGEALVLARRLYQRNPRLIEALTTMGDAYLAVGKYREAEEAYQELMNRAPRPPVLARLAHLAELQGRPEEALQLMQQAAADALAADQAASEMAWYLVRLGDLHFNAGRIQQAGKYYEAALRLVDNYYVALAGLGRVRAAQGDYAAAIDLYRQATAIIPQPDLLATLGDLYALTDRPDQAQRQYETVEYTGRLAQINRQVYNRQLANFYADHDMHLAEALTLATSELQVRQDIYGFDTAAWAYYKNGRLTEAQEMIERAMQLGTRDAKLFYHAGMIAHAQGRTAEAEALLAEAMAVNPHFDPLQARLARAILGQLQAD